MKMSFMAYVFVFLFASIALGAGDTPISELKLTTDANGNDKSITNVSSVVVKDAVIIRGNNVETQLLSKALFVDHVGMYQNLLLGQLRWAIWKVDYLDLVNGFIDGFGTSDNIDLDLSKNIAYSDTNTIRNFIIVETPITSLIAHWKMNDVAANQTVIDNVSAYNGTHTTNTEAVSVAGKINSALSFDGSQNVDCGDILIPEFSSSFTVCCWVYQSSRVSQSMMVSKDSSSGRGFNFFLGDFGNIYVEIQGDSQHVTSATVGMNEWHHVLFSYDRVSNTVKIYLDGNKELETNEYGTLQAGPSLMFGSRAFNGSLETTLIGYLDDIRIYTEALTEEQIATIYVGGSGTETEGTGKELIGNMSLITQTLTANKSVSRAYIAVALTTDSSGVNTNNIMFGVTYGSVTNMVVPSVNILGDMRLVNSVVDMPGSPLSCRTLVISTNSVEVEVRGIGVVLE